MKQLQKNINDVNMDLLMYFPCKPIKCIEYTTCQLSGYKIQALLQVNDTYEILIRNKNTYINSQSNIDGYKKEITDLTGTEDVIKYNGSKFVPWPYGNVSKKTPLYAEKLKVLYACGVLNDPEKNQKPETIEQELKRLTGSPRMGLIFKVVKQYEIISIEETIKTFERYEGGYYRRNAKMEYINCKGLLITHTKGLCFIDYQSNERVKEIFTSLLQVPEYV